MTEHPQTLADVAPRLAAALAAAQGQPPAPPRPTWRCPATIDLADVHRRRRDEARYLFRLDDPQPLDMPLTGTGYVVDREPVRVRAAML
jgi:hypothetical protein